jgi:hypothetical protein
MGGAGSGRKSGGGRAIADACCALDVNRLHRDGCLRPGWTGGWQWTRSGDQAATINLRAERDALFLLYRVRIGGRDWEDVAQIVLVVRAACTLGGERSYFVCPGDGREAGCGRRVAKLYVSGRYFLCRHCHRLSHASQREGRLDRVLRRANKVRRRLGGDPGVASLFPPRPKGMWARTYKRLRDRVLSVELSAEQDLERHVARVLARLDEPRGRRSFWS